MTSVFNDLAGDAAGGGEQEETSPLGRLGPVKEVSPKCVKLQ